MVKANLLLHLKNDTEKQIKRKCDCKDYDTIYDLIMLATDGDHEIAQNIASWCGSEFVGAIYGFREGIVKIVDD